MSNRTVAILPLALLLALPCAAAPAGDIRVRRDELHARIWVLRADALYLYPYDSQAPARRFTLPRWIYVISRSACEPDLLVEAGGTVIVSSNIMPSLWRVDPEASSAIELELEAQPQTTRELGFTALRWAGPGALHARGSLDRSRWLIDLPNRSATKLEGAVPGAGC
jgi:hypothetical protein